MTAEESERALTEERLVRLGVLQELTASALDLFDPSREMDDFLVRLASRLGCSVVLCLEGQPGQPLRLLGSAGLASGSRELSLPRAEPEQDLTTLALPYPELSRPGLTRWSLPLAPASGHEPGARLQAGELACSLVLVFSGPPPGVVVPRKMVERLAELLGTAVLHRRLFARSLANERTLREQKALLEYQRESSNEGLVFLSPDGWVVSYNRRLLEMLGLPESEVKGVHVEQLIASVARRAERPSEFESRAHWLVSHPHSMSLDEVRLANGRVFERYAAPVVTLEGTFLGRGVYYREITARRRAEQARDELLRQAEAGRDLAERAERRATFLAGASTLLASRADDRAALVELAERMVPYLADWVAIDLLEENGQLSRVAVAHADPGRRELAAQLAAHPPELAAEEGVGRVVRSGRPSTYSGLGGRPGGPVPARWPLLASPTPGDLELVDRLGLESCLIVPLLARGKTLGALTLVSASPARTYGQAEMSLAADLAQRIAMAVDNARLFRATQDAVQVREEFISIAAHELRNPLAALLLAVQRLQRLSRQVAELCQLPVGADQAALIAVAERQCQRLVKLVDSLLDVARIQAGKLELELEPVDLAAVAREVVLRHRAEPRGETIQFRAEGPLVGTWDRLRLDQVVDNLLSNALKYGEGKPIQVEVSGQGELAVLSVRDQGIGIAVDSQGQIFERFKRAVSARRYGGVGLGLHIVRWILEALGGSISFQSTPGQGSTFTAVLPRSGPLGPRPQPESLAEAAPPA